MIKQFKNPPNDKRPIPFWSWNDKLNRSELKRQMDAMIRAGYGGFFIHSRVGLVTKYLSDDWMDLVRYCVEEGEKLGLKANLYDEDMWPSGYAAGEVPAAGEEYREKALVLVTPGSEKLTDTVIKAVVYKGQDYLICARTCETGNPRFGGQCYVDIFNPNAVRLFFERTHERYRKRMGEFFGKQIEYMFSDEVCYGIHWFYTEPHVTYSPYLAERFFKDCGYALSNRVEELFFDIGDYVRTRYDYYRTASKQFNESYTIPYQKYCRKNGLKFTGHLMAEDSLYEQAQWTAGVMPCYEYMDVPGIDKLFRTDENQLITLRQMISVAEQLSKPRTLCECFAGIGQEAGFLGRKRIVDWLAVNGIDLINPHLSHYSMRGERKRDYPPNLNVQQPYFSDEKIFSDYTARISQLARYGHTTAKVLILSPLRSVLSQYSPFEPKNEEVLRAKYDFPFSRLCRVLSENKIEWHIGDESILERHGHVEDGKLFVGSVCYDTVVLPPISVIGRVTASLLSSFRGNFYAIGETPSRIEGVAENIDLNCQIVLLDALIRELKRGGYSHFDNDDPLLISGLRERGEEKVCLLANRAEESREIFLDKFSFRANRVLCLSDGEIYLLPKETSSFTLLPGGSIVLYYDPNESKAMPLPFVTRDGAEFWAPRTEEIFPSAVRILDENALPLDHAVFRAKGEETGFVHFQQIWHSRFYPLEDGTPFEVEYRFEVESVPEGKIFAVVENAENLDEILCNGISVIPLRKRGEEQIGDDKSYVDVSMTRIEITDALQKGTNTLLIRGIKINNIVGVGCHRSVDHRAYFATEAEIAYLVGNFSVLRRANKYVLASAIPVGVGDITKQGYPFYSGRIAYDFEESVHFLRIGGNATSVSCEESASFEPFVLQVDRQKFTVMATNTLYALFGPHYLNGYDELKWVDPGVFNDGSRYSAEVQIKAFGLDKFEKIEEN